MIELTTNKRIIVKKNHKQWVKNRRTGRMMLISSNAYLKRSNEIKVEWSMQLQKIREQIGYSKPIIENEVVIFYEFDFKGKLWADADNLIASINDMLEDIGVIANDRLIKKGSFIVKPGQKDWFTKITIIPIEETKIIKEKVYDMFFEK